MEVEPSTPRKDDRFLHVLTAASVDAFKPVDAKYVSEENRDGVIFYSDIIGNLPITLVSFRHNIHLLAELQVQQIKCQRKCSLVSIICVY